MGSERGVKKPLKELEALGGMCRERDNRAQFSPFGLFFFCFLFFFFFFSFSIFGLCLWNAEVPGIKPKPQQ